jgi:RNA polymerase sigma-70 factor (ECF subfamily)
MADCKRITGGLSDADFHQALRRSGDRWYSACLYITRSPALAEDAVQDGLLQAWHKRRQFNGAAMLDTWIHRIVVNAALQLLRRNKTGANAGATADAPIEPSAPVEADTPLETHAHGELVSALAHKLDTLTEYERICFVLKHIEEWRLGEIAHETGNSINSVKQALFRALKKLRIGLADWRMEA